MRRSLRTVLVLLAITIVYLLAWPVPIRPELIVKRRWSVDVATASVAAGVTGGTVSRPTRIPFLTEQSFGYLSAAGSVLYRGARAGALALSENGFVSYSRTPDQLILQQPGGEYRATIGGPGYPEFAGDALFVRTAADSKISSWSLDGVHRWTRSLPGPVTTVTADGGVTLVGMATGGIIAMDGTGSLIPVDGTDNRYAATVYGSALCAVAGTAAAVIGPADPGLVIYSLRGDRFIPSLRVPVEEPRGRQEVKLTGDGRYVLYDDAGIGVVDLTSGTRTTVAMAYPVMRIEPETSEGLAAAVGVGDLRVPQRGFRYPAELVAFRYDGITPVRVSFAADRVSLTARGNDFYLGSDDRMLSFVLETE